MSDSDLFEMHKIHMLNMLKYTESIKEMTELVDKLIYLSYNTNLETGYNLRVTWRTAYEQLDDYGYCKRGWRI